MESPRSQSANPSVGRYGIGRMVGSSWLGLVTSNLEKALPDFEFSWLNHPAIHYVRYWELNEMFGDLDPIKYEEEARTVLTVGRGHDQGMNTQVDSVPVTRKRVKKNPDDKDAFNIQIHLKDNLSRGGGYLLERERGLVRTRLGLDYTERLPRGNELIQFVDLGSIGTDGSDCREHIRDTVRQVRVPAMQLERVDLTLS